jgi:hypothetical protein
MKRAGRVTNTRKSREWCVVAARKFAMRRDVSYQAQRAEHFATAGRV